MECLSRRGKLLGAAFIGALAGIALAPGDAEAVTVKGYGHYCSITWPSGGWAFESDTNGNDPCGSILSKTDPGGTIQRAGVYDANRVNTAIVRCSDNTFWMYGGVGNGPLTAAFNAAQGHPGCIFTVAPQNLEIFRNSPFHVTPKVTNGFDFIKDSFYGPLNPTEFGQSGSSTMIMNLRGAAKTYGNDHDGYDWVVPEGTEIYALADGVVQASRNLDTGCKTESNSPIQGEVYIRHTVDRVPSTYNEEFVAGYFHLVKRADLRVGDRVTADQYLGKVGWVGCSSESHLHFAVYRTTNVATAYRSGFAVPADEVTANDGWRTGIDPYGFRPPKNIDPWGWAAFDRNLGALSINLWLAGSEPSLGDWGKK